MVCEPPMIDNEAQELVSLRVQHCANVLVVSRAVLSACTRKSSSGRLQTNLT